MTKAPTKEKLSPSSLFLFNMERKKVKKYSLLDKELDKKESLLLSKERLVSKLRFPLV